MMVKPTVNELLEKAENRYALVIATSKRARQLAEGAEPLTDKHEESFVTLAAQEIAEGKVTAIADENPEEDDEKNIAEPDIEANIEVENPTRK